MPGFRAVWIALAFALTLVGCRSGDATRPIDPGPAANTPASPSQPIGSGSLTVSSDAGIHFVGELREFDVSAFDVRGSRVSSVAARAVSTDTSIAVIERQFVIRSTDAAGHVMDDAGFHVRLRGAGTTTLRVSLGNLTQSTAISTESLPAATSAVAVDSFAVVEYRPECAWACPYVLYAPVFKLREATGVTSAEVIAVQFDIPGMTTGLCRGSFALSPGQSAFINGIDPYPWSSDFVFASPDDAPIPDGPVAARAVVRLATGEYGLVQVTGHIQRGVTNPSFPEPTGRWGC